MYCTKCGNQLENDAQFCNKCGIPTNNKEMNQGAIQNQNLDLKNKNKKKNNNDTTLVIAIVFLTISILLFVGMLLLNITMNSSIPGVSTLFEIVSLGLIPKFYPFLIIMLLIFLAISIIFFVKYFKNKNNTF